MPVRDLGSGTYLSSVRMAGTSTGRLKERTEIWEEEAKAACSLAVVEGLGLGARGYRIPGVSITMTPKLSNSFTADGCTD